MKVFFSWSKSLSHDLAHVFADWLPSVIQAVRPYFTPNDIGKGARWSNDIASELEECEIGLIFLTHENLESPWMLFEAGALSKHLAASRVCPILFRITPANVRDPLAQFQLTLFAKEDILRLLSDLNNLLAERGLPPNKLHQSFEKWWPDLEVQVQEIYSKHDATPQIRPRPERELLEEILLLHREATTRDVTVMRQSLRSAPVMTLLREASARFMMGSADVWADYEQVKGLVFAMVGELRMMDYIIRNRDSMPGAPNGGPNPIAPPPGLSNTPPETEGGPTE